MLNNAAIADNPEDRIFPLVAQVSDRLQANPQEAQQCLERLRDIVPRTIGSLERTGRELDEKQRKLEDEVAAILRDTDNLKQAQKSLKNNIDSFNASKRSLQSSLDSANSDLSRAESEKRRAEKDKDDAVAGTVAGGVGAVVLGILFPPSLAVTVPAVAAGGTISISNANKEIDRCRDRISSIRGSIAEKERQISTASNDIANKQRCIEEYEQRKQQLHAELGRVKNRSAFMLRAKNYFDELMVAVEIGQNPTDLLHRFVEKANHEEQYVILNSEGVRRVARSFRTAWEEVNMVVNDDQEGFMNIDFVEMPHVQ